MPRRGSAVAAAAAVAVVVSVLFVSQSAGADGHRAVRTLDVAVVEPGGVVEVTIGVRRFGRYGRVSEVLPAGWVYSGSSLPEAAVSVEDGTVRFLLLNLDRPASVEFTYTMTAPDTQGVFALSGTVEDSDRDSRPVIGHREIVVVDGFYAESVAHLHSAGVLGGTMCAEGFCPHQPIDRKTMAVWVVRILDGKDPQPVTESRFDDVDPAGFRGRFIERMAELGVTVGCGDGSGFCPNRSVSRAQMAVLLSRAYSLPEGPDPGFTDVPDDAWYGPDVAKLAASEITQGCADGLFCPDDDTTRGEMAIFLHRAEKQKADTSAG